MSVSFIAELSPVYCCLVRSSVCISASAQRRWILVDDDDDDDDDGNDNLLYRSNATVRK